MYVEGSGSGPWYYPGMYLEGLRKTTKPRPGQPASGSRFEPRDLPYAKQECLPLDNDICLRRVLLLLVFLVVTNCNLVYVLYRRFGEKYRLHLQG
jgi:hypothetical protein